MIDSSIGIFLTGSPNPLRLSFLGEGEAGRKNIAARLVYDFQSYLDRGFPKGGTYPYVVNENVGGFGSDEYEDVHYNLDISFRAIAYVVSSPSLPVDFGED